MSSYVVLGGTGKVGHRLVRILTAHGHDARPVSRTTPTPFDWRDETTWPAALDGASGMFVVGPGSATDWSAILTGLLDVAADAGAAHAVLLSARGVEFHPDGAVATAETALRDGPLAWTILRPTHFAQNFTEAMFTPVNDRIVAPVGDGAEPFVDVDDIAEVAAVVLTGRAHDGEVVALSGPEAITFTEAAAVLRQTTGRPVVFVPESDGDHLARLRAAGTPEGYIAWRMAMLRGIRSGADAYLSDGVTQVLGRSATRFRDWAAREASPR
ncbi:NAD(P)H-binding protein [Parafrankia elaeagni]|uniref:NAD(P)H-binding protein n=1 Tax=Parafrankia elaeagni TaxID=222534 RepID=UPI000368A716|nr:NAD(P)H-binding protein [Parafrankia elaeagni]